MFQNVSFVSIILLLPAALCAFLSILITSTPVPAFAVSQNYSLITKWGSLGAGPGQFNGLNDAHESNGYIYVPDYNNNRIQKFDSNGKFITKFGMKGTGGGQFGRPEGVYVDPSGIVYVADTNNARVQKFAPQT